MKTSAQELEVLQGEGIVTTLEETAARGAGYATLNTNMIVTTADWTIIIAAMLCNCRRNC